MILQETTLAGVYITEPEKRMDARGFFARTFCANVFKDKGLESKFVQGNMSRTLKKHTIRGMHCQIQGAAEAKLVRCTKGSILDVVLDLRSESPTYCQYFSIELSEENARQIYIPKGFAHGFCTLSDQSEVAYLVSAFYAPGKEFGLRWNDSQFGIVWPTEQPILSEKDANYPDFQG